MSSTEDSCPMGITVWLLQGCVRWQEAVRAHTELLFLPHIHAELRLLLSLRREGKSEGWFCFWSWKYDHSNCYYALAHHWFLLCRFTDEWIILASFMVFCSFHFNHHISLEDSDVYKLQYIYSSLLYTNYGKKICQKNVYIYKYILNYGKLINPISHSVFFFFF